MNDFLDISGGNDRDDVRQAALAVASLYTVFVTDERGRQLLAQWDEQLMNRRTPTNATINEYAANEALRAFVAGIHQQIRFATTEGRGTT